MDCMSTLKVTCREQEDDDRVGRAQGVALLT